MLEKLFTTKMSADKKTLQTRFLKIRSRNGRFSKIVGGIVFGTIVVVIICVGLFIAIRNSATYRMTEEDFSNYINRPIGSVMAELDYVDDEKVVFHYLDGFFVADQQSNELVHKINLGKLNIAGHTQGDSFSIFNVDKDGKFAYITNSGLHEDRFKKYDDYIINLETGAVKVGGIPDGVELFSDYRDTFSTVPNAFGWCSDRCIRLGEERTFYLTTLDSDVAAIQLVTDIRMDDYENIGKRYVFGNDYVSTDERKLSAIRTVALRSTQEILVNSGDRWETNRGKVEAIFNKLAETRNLKHPNLKDGNYDVRMYSVWDTAKEESSLMLFIFDNYSNELIFFLDIRLDEQKYLANLLNNPGMPQKEFYPQEIKNITHAELMVNGKVYPLLDSDNLGKIERMLSTAQRIQYGTDCPLSGILVLTNATGERGTVTLATDSCAVFVSNGAYYDYSDGDNAEMWNYFGIASGDILHLTT